VSSQPIVVSPGSGSTPRLCPGRRTGRAGAHGGQTALVARRLSSLNLRRAAYGCCKTLRGTRRCRHKDKEQVISTPLIAVVNDDTTFLSLMKEILEDEGFQVQLHIGGDLAYQMVRETRPDLVILDIRMPNPAQGWETLDLLRLDPATTHIPVIICSADPQQLNEKGPHLESLRCRAIEKPFDLDILLSTIREMLDTTRDTSER
jgi:CheY-like chemotaxis protein